MSSDVEFHITAFDEAQSAFGSVSSEALECFNTVETKASEMQETVGVATSEMGTNLQESSSAVAASQEASQTSFAETAMSMNNVAVSAATLYMTMDRVENSSVALDRAHLIVQKSTLSVQKATEACNEAVAKYGANSQEAKDAVDKLTNTQEQLRISQERADLAQRNYNNSLIMTGVTIIPSVISAISAVSHATEIWEGIQAAMNVVMDANPIFLVVAAIAALTAGIVWAYENCKPFRDIINAIGGFLGGVLKTTVDSVSAGLGWLWKNVFVPLGEFLGGVFMNYLGSLKATWDALSGAVLWLWKNVLEPVAEFFKGVFTAAINLALAPVHAFEAAINKVASVCKPLTDFIGGLGNALKNLCFAHAAPAAEEFNKQVTESIAKTESLTSKLDPLKGSLIGISGNMNVNQSGLGGGTQHITVYPTINIGKLDRTTGLRDLIDAANQGTALALQRRL